MIRQPSSKSAAPQPAFSHIINFLFAPPLVAAGETTDTQNAPMPPSSSNRVDGKIPDAQLADARIADAIIRSMFASAGNVATASVSPNAGAPPKTTERPAPDPKSQTASKSQEAPQPPEASPVSRAETAPSPQPPDVSPPMTIPPAVAAPMPTLDAARASGRSGGSQLPFGTVVSAGVLKAPAAPPNTLAFGMRLTPASAPEVAASAEPIPAAPRTAPAAVSDGQVASRPVPPQPATQRSTNQPDTSEPETQQLPADQMDSNQSDAKQPDVNQPDVNQPDANEPDANQPVSPSVATAAEVKPRQDSSARSQTEPIAVAVVTSGNAPGQPGGDPAGDLARQFSSPAPESAPDFAPPQAAGKVQATSPPSAAESLRTAEPAAPASSAQNSAPAQQIAVRITPPQSPSVDVQLMERGGQVHVAVRTADGELQTSLRQDLGTLVNSLERAGFRTEAFTPREAVQQTSAAAPANSQNGRQDSESGSGGRGNSGDTSQDTSRNPGDQQQQRSRDQRPQKWIAEMENQQ